MTLATHTWWDVPHLGLYLLIGGISAGVAVVVTLYVFIPRLLRTHTHRGFRYLRCVNRRGAAVNGEHIKVAFDVDEIEERNRRMDEWSRR